MILRRARAVALGILAALVLTVSSAQASTMAATMTDTTGLQLGNPPFTLGWSFTTTDDITVTDLGLFDDSQDGLVNRYEIALWDSSANLLVSTVLPNGTSAALDGAFRFTSIAPTLLVAGQTYFIGALFGDGSDPLIFPGSASNFATAPEVTFVASQFAAGGSLAFPGSTGGSDPAYFGPNFKFTVPEPASLMLVGFGIASVAARRRRTNKA